MGGKIGPVLGGKKGPVVMKQKYNTDLNKSGYFFCDIIFLKSLQIYCIFHYLHDTEGEKAQLLNF